MMRPSILCLVLIGLSLVGTLRAQSVSELQSQDFTTDSSGTVLLGGSRAPGCFSAADNLAYFNTPGQRTLFVAPIFEIGSQKICFDLSTAAMGSCSLTTANHSEFKLLSIEAGVNSTISSPILQPNPATKRLVTGFFGPFSNPDYSRVLAVDALNPPSGNTDFWGVDNIVVSCGAIACPLFNPSFTILEDDFDGPSQLTLTAGQKLSDGFYPDCNNFDATQTAWMRDATSSGGDQRIIATSSTMDLSQGGTLSFQLNIPSECNATDDCDCSSGTTPLWINELVTNNLPSTHTLFTYDYGNPLPADLTVQSAGALDDDLMFGDFIDCSAADVTAGNCVIVRAVGSTPDRKNRFLINPDNQITTFSGGRGMGFEIAGKPGTNLTGYIVKVFGARVPGADYVYSAVTAAYDYATSSGDNCDANHPNGYTGCDIWFNIPRPDTLDDLRFWSIATLTLPESVLVGDPDVTTSRMGFASFTFDWGWEAACILPGLLGNEASQSSNHLTVELSGHSCHIFLMDPDETEVLHRVIIGNWYQNHQVAGDWLASSFYLSGASGGIIAVPCFSNAPTNQTWLNSGSPNPVPLSAYDCTARAGYLGASCTNCFETASIFSSVPSPNNVIGGFASWADGQLSGPNAKLNAAYTCGTMNIYQPNLFDDLGCSIRTTQFGILHPSLSMIPQSGSPDCFTTWPNLGDYSKLRSMYRTLFSPNDDAISSQIPNATSEVVYIPPFDLARRNRGATDIKFSCAVTDTPPTGPFCCGITSDQSFLQLEGRVASGSWRGIESLSLDRATESTNGWTPYTIQLPSWMKSASAELRWIQYPTSPSAVLGTGAQAWGIDQVIVTDGNPLASNAGFALAVSNSTQVVLTQVSVPPSFSMSVLIRIPGVALSDTVLFSSPGLTITQLTSGDLQVSITCSSSTYSAQLGIPSFGTWLTLFLSFDSTDLFFRLGGTSSTFGAGFCPSLVPISPLTLTGGIAPWYIDELRFFGVKLSDATLSSLSDRHLTASEVASTSLLAEYHFDKGSCGLARSSINPSSNYGILQATATTCAWVPSTATIYYDVFVDRINYHSQAPLRMVGTDIEQATLSPLTMTQLPSCGSVYDPAVSATTPITVPYTTASTLIYDTTGCAATAGSETIGYSVSDIHASASGLIQIRRSALPTASETLIPESFNQRYYYIDIIDITIDLNPVNPDILIPTSSMVPAIVSLPASGDLYISSVLVATLPANVSAGDTLTYVFKPSVLANFNTQFLDDVFHFSRLSGVTGSDRASVFIQRQAPMANDDSILGASASGGQEFFILYDTLFQNDVYLPSDADKLVVLSVGDSASLGTNFLTNNGSQLTTTAAGVYVKPFPGFTGSDSFRYVLSLNLTGCKPTFAVVSFTVTNNPTALNADDSHSVDQDATLSVDLGYTVFGLPSDPLLYIDVLPLHGQLFESLDGITASSPFPIYKSDWLLPTNFVIYDPTNSYIGPDSFTFYVVNAPNEYFSTPHGTISITVNAVLQVPVVSDILRSVTVDSLANNIDLTLAVYEPTNAPRDIWVVTLPLQGNLTCLVTGLPIALPNTNCSLVSYRPDSGYLGPDSFTFTANNSAGYALIVGTVHISVEAFGPEAYDFSDSINQDETLRVSLTNHSNNPGYPVPYNFFIDQPPINGVLYDTVIDSTLQFTPLSAGDRIKLNSVGQFYYIPNALYVGNDEFKWHVSSIDGTSSSQVATFAISMLQVFRAPTVTPGNHTLAEGTPLAFTLAASEEDSQQITYRLDVTMLVGQLQVTSTSAPVVGTYTGTENAFTYTPPPFYNGIGYFYWFAINPQSMQSQVVSELLIITPVGNAPVIPALPIQTILGFSSTPPSRVVTFTVQDHDPQDTILCTLSAPPLSGSVYQTLDGISPSGPALALNDPLSVARPASLVYAPSAYGLDSLEFDCEDTYGLPANSGSPLVIDFEVFPGNNAPYMMDSVVNIQEGIPTPFTLNATAGAVPIGNLMFQLTGEPEFPLLRDPSATQILQGETTAATVSYEPPPQGEPRDYNGIFDFFDVRAFDSPAGSYSYPVRVSVHINNLNDPPTASGAAYTVLTSSSTPFAPVFDDPDRWTSPQNLTLNVVSLTPGTVEDGGVPLTTSSSIPVDPVSPIELTFIAPSTPGVYTFRFDITDGDGLSSGNTDIVFTVQAPNTAPATSQVSLTVQQGFVGSFNLTATDDYTPRESLRFSIVDLGNLTAAEGHLEVVSNVDGSVMWVPPNGLPFSFTDSYLRFTPSLTFHGDVWLDYTAADTGLPPLTSVTTTVLIQILPNAATRIVVADPNTIFTDQDVDVTFSFDFYNSDPSNPEFFIVSLPSSGDLFISPSTAILAPGSVGSVNSFVYSPDPGFYGFDTFVFDVQDGAAVSPSPATATVYVRANTLPPAGLDESLDDDKVSILPISPKPVTPFVSPQNLYILSLPTQGKLTALYNLQAELTPPFPILAPSTLLVSYKSDFDAIGADSFTFAWGRDGVLGVPGTITINITTEDYPVPDAISFTIDQRQAHNVVLTAQDPQPVGGALTYDIANQSLKGTLAPVSAALRDATYAYTPFDFAYGGDNFTFSVTDETGLTSYGTVSILIHTINLPPTANNVTASVPLNDAVDVTLSGSDFDSDYLPGSLAYQIVSLPGYGKLVKLSDSTEYQLGDFVESNTLRFVAQETLAVETVVDMFQFLVYDPTLTASLTVGQVFITITGNNTAPVANGALFSVAQDSALLISVADLVTDPDVTGGTQTLNLTILSVPNAGTGTLYQISDINVPTSGAPIADNTVLTDPEGRVWFVPALGFSCLLNETSCDQFSYSANDGSASSSNIALLLVQFVQAPPVLLSPLARNITILQGQSVVLPLTSWVAPISGTLQFVISQLPSKGVMEAYDCATNTSSSSSSGFFTSDCVLYVPQPLVFGDMIDSLKWYAQIVGSVSTVSSAAVGSISISITQVIQAPSCSALRVQCFVARPVTVTLYGYDVYGDPIGLQISKVSQWGTLWQFSSNATNNKGARIVGTRTFLTDSNNRLVYSPPTDRTGIGLDSFLYKACAVATGLCSEVCTVKIDVNAAIPPIPTAQRVTVLESTPEIITLQGTDVTAGVKLSAIISYLPLVGKLYQVRTDGTRGLFIDLEGTPITDSENRVFYFPPLFLNGDDIDSFGFRVTDGLTASLIDADVTIDITPVPTNPISSNVTVSGQLENTPFAIILSGYSPDGNPMTSFIDTLPLHGVLIQSGASARVAPPAGSVIIDQRDTRITDPRGKVIYYPNDFFYGSDSFSFYVIDSAGLRSASSTVNLQILHVNNAPVGQPIVAYNIDPLQFTPYFFNATDVDGDKMVFVVATLPNSNEGDVELFQADDAGEIITNERIVIPNTIVTNANAKIFVSPRAGEFEFSFDFQVYDSFGAKSELIPFWGNVTTIPPAPPSGLPLPALAGIGAGVGVICVLLLLAFIWWYRRRARQHHSIAGSLVQRKSSKDMLERLLTEPDMAIVLALAKVADVTEADELAQAMVALFLSNETVLQKILVFISMEVRSSDNPSTLFRANSLASKMLKVYSKRIGIPYLQAVLSELILEVIDHPGAYEVNKQNLGPDQSLETQWQTLTSTTKRFLEAIFQSSAMLPVEFKKICSHLYQEVIQQYPGFHNAHTFVGGFLFLRFICPAIVAPEVYNLCPHVPPMAVRRGLILISKAIQNLSNGVQFGSKEEYMTPMNPFIVENIHRIRDFLLSLAQAVDVKGGESHMVDIDNQEKQDALDILHRHLFVHQEEVYKELATLTLAEGLNRDYMEHLAAFDLLLSYPTELTEEIINTLISDLPLVAAICHSIPVADHTLARALVTVFEFHELTITLLQHLIREEASDVHASNMLFRGFSPAMKMSKEYLDIIGLNYLQQTLGVTLKIICKEPSGYDIDRKKLSDVGLLNQNLSRFEATVQEIFVNILGSIRAMPPQLRIICHSLFEAVGSSSFSDKQSRTVSDFVFAKTICPAILSPFSYGIVDDLPGPEVNRLLLLITKMIQAIANGKAFPANDVLEPLNHLIPKYQERVHEFLAHVVDIPPSFGADAQSFMISEEVLTSSVCTIHRHLKDDSDKIRGILTPDAREAGNVRDRLEAILLDMGPPIQINSGDRECPQSSD